MPDAKVLQVPRGSVIVLSGVQPPFDPEIGDVDIEAGNRLKADIAAQVGHDEFALIFVEGDGEVHVADTDEVLDLIARATET